MVLSVSALGVAALAVGIGAVTHAALAATPTPSHIFTMPDPKPTEPIVPWYTIPEPGPVSFTLVAVGDALPHAGVVISATRSGSYNFDALWSELDPWVAGADLAICHMEVPVAPAGSSLSGYPVFAAPKELVAALHDQGWDGCSTASNHSVDKGFNGIVATLDAFDEVRMGAVGTARSADEAASAQYYKVRTGSRTIVVAQISFTFGLNGFSEPADEPWAANTFDAANADVQPILDAAQAARDNGADVVIASIHCCVEYVTQPTRTQREIAQKIADSGLVDLYIGHHAHVPQPIELLPGGPNGDGMWVAFGLGNYISNQDANCCVPQTSNGIFLTATFTVDLDDKVSVGVEWTPITVDRLDHHTVHVLSEIPNGAGTLSAAQVAARYKLVSDAVGTQAPERLTPPSALADTAFPLRRKPWAPGD